MNRTENFRYFPAVFVSLITFAVYLSSLHHGFVEWDDSLYVFENPHIRSVDFLFFRWAFLDFHVANWHPLTWISHALDYSLWGLNPLGHHLTNIILHAANTFMVVFLTRRVLKIKEERTIRRGLPASLNERTVLFTAGVTGILFGLHPMHVESVAWVAERKDLLCAFFFLCSIAAYTKYVRLRDDDSTRKTSPSRVLNRQYLFTLGFFILALLSKPMAVSLPFVLLILDWYPLDRIRCAGTFKTAFIEKIPFIVLSLISSVVTFYAQKAGNTLLPTEAVPLSDRTLVAAKSLVVYAGKMIVPLNLVPFYPYPYPISFLSYEYLLPIVLVIGITILCAVLAGRQKLFLSVWSYYVITLMPVLGIVQVGSQSMADRYTYLPSLGPFLLLGLLGGRISTKVHTITRGRIIARGISITVALLVLVSMTYVTLGQIGIWKNSFTLWNYVIEKEPGASLAYNGRGVAFYRIRELDKAIADVSRAIELNPKFGAAYYNLACLSSLKNKTEEACHWLMKGMENGYNDREHITKDPDLDNIRDAPCYKGIMDLRE